MENEKYNAFHTNIAFNNLPIGREEGMKDFGLVLSMGFQYGLNLEKNKDKLKITVLSATNIMHITTPLYQFQTTKIFEILTDIDEGGIKHISCDFLTISIKEHYVELQKIECIHTRNTEYQMPTFQQLYPIASAAYKRFIDGTNKFPSFDN